MWVKVSSNTCLISSIAIEVTLSIAACLPTAIDRLPLLWVCQIIE
ncbi:hypothetical protein PALI_a1270 [Pseudoalteromonas aliena SW19]|uniref:Uncharacterized protein n=1 Tax=Pseudoalteromonas aliena SW19 TaxID=1314866 RepID=A0ABR9E069_9GAMM|nr:hypothetical protein [Pseudoalteromonas aliena SW19]